MNCTLCPRTCKVNRQLQKGACHVATLRIARISLHKWEEPCISGQNGSGTIFFSGCNLRCLFCQNELISRSDYGLDINITQLGRIMLYLQKQGATNINLVSPTQFSDVICTTLQLYKPKLRIPVLYNCNAYENVDNIRNLNGLVDIYLPDFKYFSNDIAKRFSGIDNYRETAIACLTEMKRQQKRNVFVNGILKRGVIVRHLVLPNNTADSKDVLRWLAAFDRNIYVSLMSQYFPTPSVLSHPTLNRPLSYDEYNDVCNFLVNSGLHNGYKQDLSSNSKSYVPDFDLTTLGKILDEINEMEM